MKDNGRVGGICFDEFTPADDTPIVNGLLYYGTGKLTDKYFIQNVYVWGDGDWTNEGEHFIYVYGEVEEGDLLTTGSIRGVAQKIDEEEIAFARVTKGRCPTPDTSFPPVGGCYATFL